jgi:hypothetical protein
MDSYGTFPTMTSHGLKNTGSPEPLPRQENVQTKSAKLPANMQQVSGIPCHPASLLTSKKTKRDYLSPQPTWGTFAAQVVRKVSGGWKAKERTISTKTKTTAETTTTSPDQKSPFQANFAETRAMMYIKGVAVSVTMALAHQSIFST